MREEREYEDEVVLPRDAQRLDVDEEIDLDLTLVEAGIGHHPDTHAKKGGRVLAYSPDEIDLFFIVDGDMTIYLIPIRAIAGRISILLRTYRKYIVGNVRGLLEAAEAGGAAPTSA